MSNTVPYSSQNFKEKTENKNTLQVEKQHTKRVYVCIYRVEAALTKASLVEVQEPKYRKVLYIYWLFLRLRQIEEIENLLDYEL